MSKSLGNFRTIRQTIGVAGPADESATYEVNPREAEMLRFFIVRNHYRSPQNYAPDNLVDAQLSLDRLYQTLQNVPPAQVEVDWTNPAAVALREAMNDDFNTAGAIAALFDLAGQANRTREPAVSGQLKALASLLGLLSQDPAAYFQCPSRYTRRAMDQAASGNLPPGGAAQVTEQEIDQMIEKRAAAKAAKDFAGADAVRAQLKALGIELEDKPGGVTQWRRH